MSSNIHIKTTELLEDITPQLGGDLDVNGNSIVSVSNGDITLAPDGAGQVVIDGLSWPDVGAGVPTQGHPLIYTGTGQMQFQAYEIVEDATPQLGGDLDVNGNSIVSTSNADITIAPNGTGKIDLGSNIEIGGSVTFGELSADPSNPSEGNTVVWQSDGTGTGDDGDVYLKVTAGATTKTVRLVDFSESAVVAKMQDFVLPISTANVAGETNFPKGVYRNSKANVGLAYNDSTNETAIFESYLPSNYNGGGLTIDLYWAAATATSGNVIWEAAIERQDIDSHDLDADGFASNNTNTDAAPSTSGQLSKATITFTDGADMDSLAAGECFRLKVYRRAGDAGDTMTGDAELYRVVVRES